MVRPCDSYVYAAFVLVSSFHPSLYEMFVSIVEELSPRMEAVGQSETDPDHLRYLLRPLSKNGAHTRNQTVRHHEKGAHAHDSNICI